MYVIIIKGSIFSYGPGVNSKTLAAEARGTGFDSRNQIERWLSSACDLLAIVFQNKS